ncbi:MAG: hypothetical protein IKL55_03100 [Clostridia bacterium]|nr:hypothetical protein [Clostridia bacterium]
MEMKKIFKALHIGMIKFVKEYSSLFFLIGNCIFGSLLTMYVAETVAINYFGFELGKMAIAIHTLLFGPVVGVWCSVLFLRVKEILEIVTTTDANLAQAWEISR